MHTNTHVVSIHLKDLYYSADLPLYSTLQLYLTSGFYEPEEPGAISTWWGDLGTHAIVAALGVWDTP